MHALHHPSRVSLARARSLSFAHYFQAPAPQAKTRRELEQKRVLRNCFWDRYWGRANLVPRALFPAFGGGSKPREKRPGDEVGDGLANYCPFSFVPSNSPRGLCESLLGSVFSFLKWRMGRKSKHQYNLTPHLGRSGHCNLAEVEPWALLDQSQPSIQLPEQLCRTATFNKPPIIHGNALKVAISGSGECLRRQRDLLRSVTYNIFWCTTSLDKL